MKIEIFSAKFKLEYLMRKLSSQLFIVFFFYLKTEIFPITSIVFITIQSFETLIECHLKKYEELGWRW